jgi:glutathione synthase/RimK-type ligase-like ATP-grasp enzyme
LSAPFRTRAAAAVGAPLAGVDLLPGRDGKLYTIEVNAVPGWKGLAKALGMDVARMVIDFVADRVVNARRHSPLRTPY